GHRLRAQLGGVLRHRARARARGHVQRPGVRRQQELRRLGPPELPRRAHAGAGQVPADRRRRPEGPQVHLRRRPIRQGQEGGRGMSTRLKKKDVVIIGLGAAGGYASLALAKGGAEVVGLEAGPRWTADDFPMDELRNDVRNFMSQPKAAKEVPTWRKNASLTADQTSGVNILMMNGVGGSSIHYGMEQWRYLPWHFKERSETIKRYGASAIPANS